MPTSLRRRRHDHKQPKDGAHGVRKYQQATGTATGGTAVTMAQTNNKSGKNFIIPVSNGILEKKHREQIGSAIWLFLWLVDKSTKDVPVEDGFEGLVLGGAPITTLYIAEHIGESVRSVRYHLDELARYEYIRVEPRAGGANSYSVKKSKKFFRSRAVLVAAEAEDKTLPLQEVATPPAENVQGGCKIFPLYKEEIPETNQRQEAAAAKPQKKGDPRRADFIEDHQKYYLHRNGKPYHFEGGKDGKNIDGFLKNNPDVTREQWREMLRHRSNSPDVKQQDGIDHTDPLWSWVGNARRYQGGPKDRYWHPAKATARKAPASDTPASPSFAEIQRQKIAAATADRAGA